MRNYYLNEDDERLFDMSNGDLNLFYSFKEKVIFSYQKQEILYMSAFGDKNRVKFDKTYKLFSD